MVIAAKNTIALTMACWFLVLIAHLRETSVAEDDSTGARRTAVNRFTPGVKSRPGFDFRAAGALARDGADARISHRQLRTGGKALHDAALAGIVVDGEM